MVARSRTTPGTAAPHGELRALTGLRGLAAWWVVLYHLRSGLGGQLPADVIAAFGQGYLAVDLFFMLSGFVLWLNYGERLHRGGAGKVATFWWRRLARIWPLHAVILAAFVALALLFTATGRTDPAAYPFAELPLHLLLVQNWGFTDTLAWNYPAWSISTELGAYLLFPLLAAAVQWGRMPRAAIVALLFAIAVQLGLQFELRGFERLGDDITGLGLIRCLSEFAMGTLLCALWQAVRGTGSARAWPVILAALAIPGALVTGGHETFYVPLLFAALLLAVALSAKLLPALLGRGVLHYLGEISYSTYLAHVLLFIVFKLLFVADASAVPLWLAGGYLLLTLAASIALYHGVERPAQRFLNARTPRFGTPSRPSALPD